MEIVRNWEKKAGAERETGTEEKEMYASDK